MARAPRFTVVAVLAGAVVSMPFAAATTERRQGTAGAERATALVSVDFAVVSVDGEPVTDLQRADVSVRINGKTRPLQSLQLIRAVLPQADTTGASSLPPPFGTNDVPEEQGRRFHLVLDDDSFRPGREGPLREAVEHFLRLLRPDDRMSLVTMPYGGVKVPLTTDRSRVRTALSTIVGQAPVSETGSEFACRTRRTLESLVGLLQTWIPSEEPRTVIFVSGGLAPPRRDNVPMLAPGPCELVAELFQQVGTAAGAARAHFYLLLPEQLMVRPGAARRENIAGVGFTGSDNPFEGLEHLAGVTGAPRLNVIGGADAAFGRIARETSAYYVASFPPGGSDRSGRTLQVSVRVSRPGVIVRARPEITFAKPDPRGTPSTVRDMVRSGRLFRDLQLRVSAYSSREAAAEQLRLVTLIEPADPSVKIATVGAVLLDDEQRAVAQWTGSGSDITAVPIRAAMVAPPGAYRLRVGAIDAAGRGGTVDVDVQAGLAPAGPLRLSSLLLGLSRGGGFTPRLQFGSEPSAIAYVEIHGGLEGMPIAAALELARTLNGPAIATMPLAIAAGADRHIATGIVPLGALAPGDYAVRAIVGVQGQPAGRVFRTLRKVANQ